MADCAEGLCEPPKELTYAWRTEKWGPPRDGGWLEWEAGLIVKMSACLNVFNSITGMDTWLRGGGSLVDFAERNPKMWNLVTSIEELRRRSDG